MAGNTEGTLLLHDVWGLKERPAMFSFLTRESEPQIVVKGSLLIAIPGVIPRAGLKPSHNYRVYKNDKTTLYCSPKDVAPLSDYQFQLLNGIKSAGARYGVFVNGILEWGSKLTKNDVVCVTLPSYPVIGNKRGRAKIRSIGQLPDEEGIKFGLEIVEEQYRGAGYSNGTFRWQQFFVCEENCGMFESLNRLAPTADKKSQRIETTQATPNHQSKGHDFKLNSTVQCSDPPRYGILRWIGTFPGSDDICAGIELEENADQCGNGLYEGIRYFTCTSGKGFFCPLSTLKHDQRIAEQPHQSTMTREPAPRVSPIQKVVDRKLSVSSAEDPQSPKYGVVRWIGSFPGSEEVHAGIELENYADRCGNGLFEEVQYFTCTSGKGFFCPLSSLKPDQRMAEQPAPKMSPDQNAADRKLSVSSAFRVKEPPKYGVVRWIGSFPLSDDVLAGIELEEYADECGDGSFEGVQYFTCTFGKGFFCPLSTLKPDQRIAHDLSPRVRSAYVEQGKRENADLKVEVVQIQKRLEDETLKLQLEKEASEQQKQQFSRQQTELQQSQQHVEQLEQENRQFQRQIEQLRGQVHDLQQRPNTSVTPSDESRFTKVQIPLQTEDSWNVRRQEVVIQQELGHGAWGSVCKGTFRGQTVAVKRAHKEILYDNTIDQLKREIRIMVHVQHPNLVRLIAAVVDRNVEQRIDSPLLVLELLDTNLRSAYKEKNLKANNLVSIFRDVAYALHYLHEHQEPIIHRDVSAPNVLLEEVHPGVWRAKLSDFGSANLVKHCKTAAAGAIIYSAPETFPPDNPEDPLPKQTTKIDVFSYGYLLAEVIAKEMPSADKRREMLAKIQRQWRSMYELILVCIKRKPEERLTFTQVLEKLNAIPHQ